MILSFCFECRESAKWSEGFRFTTKTSKSAERNLDPDHQTFVETMIVFNGWLGRLHLSAELCAARCDADARHAVAVRRLAAAEHSKAGLRPAERRLQRSAAGDVPAVRTVLYT